ncbi:Putative odorant receptor 92a, partial [Acromyrmex echinatior]
IMTRKSTLNHTLKFMLTLCGIWPGTSYVLPCRIFWIVSLTITLFCHYRYFLTHVHSAEILDLMDCLSSFLAYSKIIIKFLVFWLNERKFVEILTVMAEDWNDCANSDISIRETTRKAKISDRFTNAIITLHTTTVVAYCIGIIIADVDVTNTTKELPLVNKVEIPFDINTQFTYRTVLITEFLLMILCGWAAGITNSLLLSLIIHVGGQMDVLQRWLAEFIPKEIENEQKSVVITTNKIILKHQKIIQISDSIESLYTYIALLIFASNTILMCSLGFLIVTAIGSPNAVEQIMKSLLFYTITNLEAFIFCYAGEYLNNKSKEIGFATYNCAWYNLKSKDSRILLFIILRSQKQLTLTAGKIMDLTLESFTSVRFKQNRNKQNIMIRKRIIDRTLEIICTLYGIWPNSRIPFCKLFWIIITIIVQFYHYRYFLIHFNSDELFNLMDCLSSCMSYMKFTTKVIVLWINQRKFYKTLEMMTEDWDSCADNEIYMNEMIRKAKLSNHINIVIVLLQLVSAFTYCVNIILADVDVTDHTSELLYIHRMELPFDVNTKRTYKIILFTQTVICIMVSMGTGVINTLLVALAIGTPDAVEQIVRSVFFFAGTNLEAFVFCFAGEYLNNKSKAIGNAAYNTAWYNLKSKDSRILSFIILRSQKQLTLTVGKMADLSLEYFTSVRIIRSI